jgi:hypothetical protein
LRKRKEEKIKPKKERKGYQTEDQNDHPQAGGNCQHRLHIHVQNS